MTEIWPDSPGKKETTIFVNPSLSRNNGLTREFAAHFETGWNKREDWERLNPKHPFNFARKGLECREYIVKNIINNPCALNDTPPDECFKTDSLNFASCLCGLDYFCYGQQEREFLFDSSAAKEEDDFKAQPSNIPIQWMKLACIQYTMLCKRIQEHDNVPVIRRERSVGKERRILLIPINCPDETRRQLEEMYYGK